MLTPKEFEEFVANIQPGVTPEDIVLHGDVIKARAYIHAETIGYAQRTLKYFERRRNEQN